MVATSKPYSPSTASAYADQALQNADSGIRSMQRTANDALDSISDKVQDVRDATLPVLNRLAGRAEDLARRSVDAVRDSGAQVRERAVRAQDATVGYIKDEPLKAILIAAAAGAAIVAIATLLSRPRD